MKTGNRKSIRTVISLLLVMLTGCFLWAGVPTLAAGTNNAQNATPIAKNLEYGTYKGIAISGQLSAIDPDGDMLTYEITDMPKRGTVQTEANGSFVYTPNEGKKGRDSFCYVAVDNNGNTSEKATVSIVISKQSTKVSYSDMEGNDAHYSSLVLAENGIIIGEKLGDQYFFHPEDTVTRGEFLAMCLGVTEAETLEGITRTGFYDDENIPNWVKPFVSTALMNGIISGYKNEDGRLVFSSQEPITFAQAAVMLNNILNITDVVSVSAVSAEVCPVWAYQAEVNLTASDIMPVMGLLSYANPVTRADAAEILTAAMTLIEARGGSTSLLSWAR